MNLVLLVGISIYLLYTIITAGSTTTFVCERDGSRRMVHCQKISGFLGIFVFSKVNIENISAIQVREFGCDSTDSCSETRALSMNGIVTLMDFPSSVKFARELESQVNSYMNQPANGQLVVQTPPAIWNWLEDPDELFHTILYFVTFLVAFIGSLAYARRSFRFFRRLKRYNQAVEYLRMGALFQEAHGAARLPEEHRDLSSTGDVKVITRGTQSCMLFISDKGANHQSFGYLFSPENSFPTQFEVDGARHTFTRLWRGWYEFSPAQEQQKPELQPPTSEPPHGTVPKHETRPTEIPWD